MCPWGNLLERILSDSLDSRSHSSPQTLAHGKASASNVSREPNRGHKDKPLNLRYLVFEKNGQKYMLEKTQPPKYIVLGKPDIHVQKSEIRSLSFIFN